MTILVTGGKGYLGSHVVRHLCDQGLQVRVLARPPENGEAPEEPHVVYADIRDRTGVERAVEGAQAVIHLVSNFRKGGSDKADAYAVNVEGTQNVMRAAHKHGVQRVVHCSTIGVHGDVKEIPANEETPFNPTDLYQETKLAAEQWVWDFHRQTGLPVSVVRPISLFGPGDTRMLKLFRMIKNGTFVMVGDGQALFQPAYIDDVVRGFMLCLTKDEAVGEAFIIGGDEYLPLNELVKQIAEELNVSPPRWRAPLGPVLAAASLVEAVCVPLGIEPPLHRRRVSFYQNSRAFSVEKAKRLLGYQPQVTLRQAIRRTIDWYEAQGWL